MLQLRPYQQEAVDAVFGYWATTPGNPLIDLATGTGKSLVQSAIMERLLEGWPDMRMVSVTHVSELIEQNFKELIGMLPFASAGIYSAGLGRRDAHSQIIFCGIQSVHNKVAKLGHVDVLFIDEVHLVPRDTKTMYGRFISDLRAINPDLKVVGLSATLYRLDSGRLDEGEDSLFDKVVYTYGIADGIRDGYLTRLVSKGMETGFDLTGVATVAGDYKKSALAGAVDKYETTRAAVQEVVTFGRSRRTWLMFCAGVEHAMHVRDEVRSHGFTCEMITGETPKEQRRRILADFKAGTIRAITNDSVMTTGTNVPGIDLIADLAPTKSTSRYVQKAGRGTRPIYAAGFDMQTTAGRLASIAAGPKPDCLYLDFAKNVRYHGPVDTAQPRPKGKGDGEAPVRLCPECHSLCHAAARECPDCGHEFPPSEEEKITARADVVPILSTGEAKWLAVNARRFSYHDKVGGTPSVRCEYVCSGGLGVHKQWHCPQHAGFAKAKADRWWHEHGGQRPFPKSVDEWLTRQTELRPTAEISVKPAGKYFEVAAWRVGKQEEMAA